VKKIIFLFVILYVTLSAHIAIKDNFFSIPAKWPKPNYDFSKNPLSQEKIELGRALFYDPILSRDNSISCNSCHSSFTAFAHTDHALSHGIDNRMGTRNAPALMNLAWEKTFMWDGAVNHLDMQPLAPMSNADEMDSNIDSVVKKLQQTKKYPSLFYSAFNDSVITGEHTLKAISQFMLTLVSANSKYDSVMRKEREFTAQENNGYRLFRQNCAACHAEPLFTNNLFENNGLACDTSLHDCGRMKVTQNPNDSMRFKVPTLRNIEFTYPYMHDGRFKHLSDVMKHYTAGIHSSSSLSEKLKKPIVLSSNEKVDVIAFLLTLSDQEFLHEKKFRDPGIK
jgi:cytochrome c peroxidase